MASSPAHTCHGLDQLCVCSTEKRSWLFEVNSVQASITSSVNAVSLMVATVRRSCACFLRACSRLFPALSTALLAICAAQWRSRRVLLGDSRRYAIAERATWFTLSCGLHGAKALLAAVIARIFRGRPRVPQWSYLFEIYVETSRAVVLYGERVLWEGPPANYTAVRKVMNLVARRTLPITCHAHSMQVLEVQCTPT